MSATPAAYNAALMEGFTQKTLEDQILGVSEVFKKIENTGSKHRQGKRALTSVKVGRNGGSTTLPSGGGTLNDAGHQQMAQAEWYFTNQFYQISIDSETIDLTDGAESIVDVVDTEVTGATDDMGFTLSRQFYSAGDSLIAQCGTTTASATVVVTSTSGQNAIKRGWIFPGMSVDIGTTADEKAIAANQEVLSVDRTNFTFTIPTAVTTTSSHYVSVKDARDGTDAYELGGLKKVVSASSTLGGLSPSVYADWQAASVDSSTTALSIDAVEQLEEAIVQTGAKKPNMVVTSTTQARKFYNLVAPQVHFASDKGIDAGSWDTARYNGKEIVADPHCPKEDFYLLNTDNLFLVTAGKPKWQNSDTGGDILTWSQGTSRFVAALRYRIQLGANQRRSFAKLSALT